MPRSILSHTQREDGWKGLVVFEVSTFNTDFILVKDKDLPRAEDALGRAGYTVS